MSQPGIGDTVTYTTAFLAQINAMACQELRGRWGVLVADGKTSGTTLHTVRVRWNDEPDRDQSVDIKVLKTIRRGA